MYTYKYGYMFKFHDYKDGSIAKFHEEFDHKLSEEEYNAYCQDKMSALEDDGRYVGAYSGEFLGKIKKEMPKIVTQTSCRYYTSSIEAMKKTLLPYEYDEGDFTIKFDYENIDSLSIHYEGDIEALWKDYWGECNLCPPNDAYAFNINICSEKFGIDILISNEDIVRLYYTFESLICDLGYCLTLEKIE